MNTIHPLKLLLSEWIAATPHNREKHSLVTELFYAEEGNVLELKLQQLPKLLVGINSAKSAVSNTEIARFSLDVDQFDACQRLSQLGLF